MATTANITRRINKSDAAYQDERILKSLSRVRKQWTTLGRSNPFNAILSRPNECAEAWEHGAFFETGVVEIEGVIQAAQRFSPVSFGTAVDFGCGVGRLSQALAVHFQRVIGIDIAESMIQAACEFNQSADRCEYLHNVRADLGVLGDASVDFVYSNITLQHMVPSLAEAYIREFFRVVRPGGHVIFQLPSRPRWAAWHRVKTIAPVALSNFLWRVRTRSPEAMESYFMPENRVKDLVEQSSGSVTSMESNQGGPPGWQSRKYFCIRTVAQA